MLCDEVIRRVGFVKADVGCDYENSISNYGGIVLHIIFRLEMHMSLDFQMVFETDSNYITVGAGGIKVFEGKAAFNADVVWESESHDIDEDDDEDDEDYMPPESYLKTVMVGERLADVKKICDDVSDVDWTEHYLVEFEHFSMDLCIYDVMEWRMHGFQIERSLGCNPIAVGEHLLSRKCACGGTGEAFFSFIEEFSIRCRQCHRSTYDHICLLGAIEEWEAGINPIEWHIERERFLQELEQEPIEYIDISLAGCLEHDETMCESQSVVLSFGENKYFWLSAQHSCIGKTEFGIGCFIDYNRDIFSRRIVPSHGGSIRFVGIDNDGEEEENRFNCLRLTLDDTEILLTACDNDTVRVSISDSQTGTHRRKVLFDEN